MPDSMGMDAMRYILPVITLAAFLWLAHYSRNQEQGYTHSVFSVLPMTLQQRQAQALREIWNLSDDDIAAPVILW